ncbi:hypothetical protein B0H10DRAFT_1957228 [Mycena sp. CBHHK59/15]|nr:hypothetical protein B0H10DRAFT_1957228 [Mycena sp. CBHHK59/15]
MSGFTFVSENKKFSTPVSATSGPPTKPVPQETAYHKNIRWGEYIPGQGKKPLNVRSLTAKVPVAHLKVSDAQRATIECTYRPEANTSLSMSPIFDTAFSVDSDSKLQHFDHNQACKDAVFGRIPPIPIHPSVYVVALSQLCDGTTFSDILWWLLSHKDLCSLYSQYNRMKGITITDEPQACASKEDHFEACIATDKMNSAAWRYAHDSQIILDRIFGVCDSHLLLFTVMAVNENRKGVPVTFLLFSAPTGNKQSSSGYNASIISKLIGKWTESLNKCASLYGRTGVKFKPCCAITDTDLKERAALIIVFPDIWLLICRFHLRQSWIIRQRRTFGKVGLTMDELLQHPFLGGVIPTTNHLESFKGVLKHSYLRRWQKGGHRLHNGDDDSASVATDASSELESDSEDANTPVVIESHPQAAQNVAALGEQALARTLFELQEVRPKFSDLAQLDRLLDLPSMVPSQAMVPAQSCNAPVTSTTSPQGSPGSCSVLKWKELLPPSPEKVQKWCCAGPGFKPEASRARPWFQQARPSHLAGFTWLWLLAWDS